MGTRILNDIHNDIKLLIATMTGFEENEEGFRICERFALSNIKHHRYLSVDSHATKREINEVTKKFSIHGKYKVAEKFQDLVSSFLTSFDFEHHPQCDLQWSLLSLLLNLSNETNKSDLTGLRLSKGEHSFNSTAANANDITDEIDWGQYLKEGQKDFFCDYQSDSESEWSSDEDTRSREMVKQVTVRRDIKDLVNPISIKRTQSSLDKLSQSLACGIESRNWLLKNIQNTWWNELDWSQCQVHSKFLSAYLCDLWTRVDSKNFKITGTLNEYQICRELLWMCHAQTQMVVFQQKNELDFFIRQNISIPSLTTTAFKDILSPFCEYFSMMREIEQFGENLHPKHNQQNVYQQPPLTYEAYNAAVSQYLLKLKGGIVEIEKQFMSQANCNTLLSLTKDLRKYLKGVKLLYEVHQSVTSDWELNLNWKSASKLLSGLYFEMQNSSSQEKANVCASLYLVSLRVYLNIIDSWLSEGRLEDQREEFIITRIPEDVTAEDNRQHERFAVRQLDPICLADPVMQLLLHKVCHIGRNIELLVNLDRIPDMWKEISDVDTTRLSLNDEFLKEVLLELSKYNSCKSIDTIDTSSLEIIERTVIKPVDLDIEQNVMQQIVKLDNPFLMKAFEEYLPVNLFRRDTVDGGSQKNNSNMNWKYDIYIFERLEDISPSILPFRKVLENTLSRILDLRYNDASKLVKDIMIKEYKLEAHLKLMRCVYMMETGHIMNKFYQLMFSEIESNPMWNNSYFLTSILEEILSQKWPDSSSRWSITVQNIRTYQVLQAVDSLTLHYAIGWPISMVLNEESLNKYNGIFRFQLKLKWALWTLDNLKFSDLEGSKSTYMQNKLRHFYVKRLECLRFWLMHAISSIHAYLSGQVLQSLGLVLEKALSQAESLDTIITVHNEYLEKVHEHCLQTPEFVDLMTTINNLLEMCVHVRDRWKCGAAALAAKELDLMESNYIKYHTYLAMALQNAVQHKDADYYKLTPHYQFCTVRDKDKSQGDENQIIDDHMTDLSRSLLTEIAYQSLPPSGISVLIPTVARKKNVQWKEKGLKFRSSKLVSLNKYDQTFSYLRWYRSKEYLNAMNSSIYILYDELNSFIKKIEGEESKNDCTIYETASSTSSSENCQDKQLPINSNDIERDNVANLKEQLTTNKIPSTCSKDTPRNNILLNEDKYTLKTQIVQLVNVKNQESDRFKNNTKSNRNKSTSVIRQTHMSRSLLTTQNISSRAQMVYLNTFRNKNSIKPKEIVFQKVKLLLNLSKSQSKCTDDLKNEWSTKMGPKKNFIKINRQLLGVELKNMSPNNNVKINSSKSNIGNVVTKPDGKVIWDKKIVEYTRISKFKQTNFGKTNSIKQSISSSNPNRSITARKGVMLNNQIPKKTINKASLVNFRGRINRRQDQSFVTKKSGSNSTSHREFYKSKNVLSICTAIEQKDDFEVNNNVHVDSIASSVCHNFNENKKQKNLILSRAKANIERSVDKSKLEYMTNWSISNKNIVECINRDKEIQLNENYSTVDAETRYKIDFDQNKNLDRPEKSIRCSINQMYKELNTFEENKANLKDTNVSLQRIDESKYKSSVNMQKISDAREYRSKTSRSLRNDNSSCLDLTSRDTNIYKIPIKINKNVESMHEINTLDENNDQNLYVNPTNPNINTLTTSYLIDQRTNSNSICTDNANVINSFDQMSSNDSHYHKSHSTNYPQLSKSATIKKYCGAQRKDKRFEGIRENGIIIADRRSKSKCDINMLYQRRCKVKPDSSSESIMNSYTTSSESDSSETHSIESNLTLQDMSDCDTFLRYSNIVINKEKPLKHLQTTRNTCATYQNMPRRKLSSNCNDNVNVMSLHNVVETLNFTANKIQEKSSKSNNAMILTLKKSSLNDKISLKLSPKNAMKYIITTDISKSKSNIFTNNRSIKDSISKKHIRGRKGNDRRENVNVWEASENVGINYIKKTETANIHTSLKLLSGSATRNSDSIESDTEILTSKKRIKVFQKSKSSESTKIETSSSKDLFCEQVNEQRLSCILS